MSIRLRKAIAKKAESKLEIEVDPDSVDNSFWFSREEDEKFEGKLITASPDEELQRSKEYADFLAASAHMSLQSFVGFQRHSSFVNPGIIEGTAIANEILPMLEHPLTWPQWFWRHKFAVLAVAYAVLGTLFLALFAIPVAQLNNSNQDCRVVGFEIFEVQCDSGNQGYCLEQKVEALLQPEERLLIAPFMGFAIVQEHSCAFTNCTEDEVVPPRNLPEPCEFFLEDTNATAEDLSDVEKLGCSKLGEIVECVHVAQSSAATKRWYFPDLEKSGKKEILSSPKQPSKQVVVTSSSLVFALLGCYFIFAIISEVSNTKRL